MTARIPILLLLMVAATTGFLASHQSVQAREEPASSPPPTNRDQSGIGFVGLQQQIPNQPAVFTGASGPVVLLTAAPTPFPNPLTLPPVTVPTVAVTPPPILQATTAPLVTPTASVTPLPPPAPPAPPTVIDPALLQGLRASEVATTLIGRPYAWSGSSPDVGFDCSGLVYYVYRQFGLTVPRDTFAMWGTGRNIGREDLAPGDLVFFENTYTVGISHVGVYIGSGRFVHAVDESTGVKANNLTDVYWAPRFVGARRVL